MTRLGAIVKVAVVVVVELTEQSPEMDGELFSISGRVCVGVKQPHHSRPIKSYRVFWQPHLSQNFRLPKFYGSAKCQPLFVKSALSDRFSLNVTNIPEERRSEGYEVECRGILCSYIVQDM